MSEVELKAIGPQDTFLFVQPQISYFKTVFRRHTNFSRFTKSIYKNSGGALSFGLDSLEFLIRQEGDLLSKMYFEVVVKGTGNGSQKYTVNHFGNSLIKNVKLIIGGIEIDNHPGTWLQVYSELKEDRYKFPHSSQAQTDSTNGGLSTTIIDSADANANRTILDITRRTNGDVPLVFGGETSDGNKSKTGTFYKKIYIPLRFFFNNNLSQALPLCSLSRHQVKLLVALETEDNLRGNLGLGDLSIHSFELFGEFIKLDAEERSKFMNTTLSYLIETVQFQSNQLPNITAEQNSTFKTGYDNTNDKLETAETTFELDTFKHPVKYISWVVTNPGTNGSNQGLGPCYFMSLCSNSEYGNDGIHGSVKIDLSGYEKEERSPMTLFTRVNPMKFCKCIPALDRIGLYSFAEDPFEPQPSGTCNFSKISGVDLIMKIGNDAVDTDRETKLKGKTIIFFAVNYNVLRISNGMAGIQYT